MLAHSRLVINWRAGILVCALAVVMGGLSSLAWTAEAAPPGQGCVPGDAEVAVFVDEEFRGRCVIRGIGDYPGSEHVGLPNDAISSIRVGSAV